MPWEEGSLRTRPAGALLPDSAPERRVLLGPATLAYGRPDEHIRGVRRGASGRRWKRIPWSLTLLLFLLGMRLWVMRCLVLQQPFSGRVLMDQGQKRVREAANAGVSAGFRVLGAALGSAGTTRPLTGTVARRGSLSPALMHPH